MQRIKHPGQKQTATRGGRCFAATDHARFRINHDIAIKTEQAMRKFET
jgi:hypothetical protein